jgi:hypothetical protein
MDPRQKQVTVYFYWRDDAPEAVKALQRFILHEVGHGPEDFETIEEAVEAVEYYYKRIWASTNKPRVEAWAPLALKYLESVSIADQTAKLLDRKDALEKELKSVNATLGALAEEP